MQPPMRQASVHSTFYNMTFHKGHVRHPHKDRIIQASHQQHGYHLKMLRGLIESAGGLPASWDSRAKGWIPPIRDQGQCGSCWDFSGTGVATVAYIRSGIFPNDGSKIFSEQYTLDCGRNGGCGGDDNVTVLEWALQTGLPLDSAYGPYQGHSGSCKVGSETLYKIDAQGLADTNGGGGIASVESIKTAIMTYGCVGSGVAADSAFSNYRAGQVFDSDTSGSIDHDIILVGWDDSKGNKGAWLLRNSWNTSWGDQGYMWIGYGINQVGSEACWASKNNPNPPLNWIV